VLFVFSSCSITKKDSLYCFDGVQNLAAKTIFLCHGTGTKNCGFTKALALNDIVLVEGDYRYEKYTKEFPEYAHKLRQVGYSKLDTVLNISEEEKRALREKYALNENKKTILYAPTFFPSSIESDKKKTIKPHTSLSNT